MKAICVLNLTHKMR